MPDTNTIDKYIIITFSMVNKPYPYHPYVFRNYYSKFIMSFFASAPKSPAENGILKKPLETSWYQKNLPFFMTEIYKRMSQINPKFMLSHFTHEELPFNLRKRSVYNWTRINSTYHGTNAFHFTGISIWNDRSAVIKSSTKSLCEFRRKIIIVEILIEDGWYANNLYICIMYISEFTYWFV